MTAIKKSVRLTEPTIKVCNQLSQGSDVNWSGAINQLAQRYNMFIDDSLPTISDNEKNAFYQGYNGHVYHQDLSEELKLMPWTIDQSYQYDEQVKEFLGSDEAMIDLRERVKNWSTSEKLAVIAMIERFWSSGHC